MWATYYGCHTTNLFIIPDKDFTALFACYRLSVFGRMPQPTWRHTMKKERKSISTSIFCCHLCLSTYFRLSTSSSLLQSWRWQGRDDSCSLLPLPNFKPAFSPLYLDIPFPVKGVIKLKKIIFALYHHGNARLFFFFLWAILRQRCYRMASYVWLKRDKSEIFLLRLG